MFCEKVKYNQKRFFVYSFVISFFIVSLICFKHYNFTTLKLLIPLLIAILIASIFITLLVIISSLFFLQNKNFGFLISTLGIKMPSWNLDICEWNNLQIHSKSFRYFYFFEILEINLTNKETNSNTYYQFGYLEIDSLIELTKKYCPKDHDFYNAVKEYATNRNIPF